MSNILSVAILLEFPAFDLRSDDQEDVYLHPARTAFLHTSVTGLSGSFVHRLGSYTLSHWRGQRPC